MNKENSRQNKENLQQNNASSRQNKENSQQIVYGKCKNKILKNNSKPTLLKAFKNFFLKKVTFSDFLK